MNKLQIKAYKNGSAKLMLNDYELEDVIKFTLEESANDKGSKFTVTVEVEIVQDEEESR